MNNTELIEKARAVLYFRQLTDECLVSEVASAILTPSGNVYAGVSISAACGIGFCAEHSAVAALITAGESRIVKVVALSGDGKIMPPCGRCRELMYQVNHANLDAEVLMGEQKSTTLRNLLPEPWQKLWD